MQRVIDNEGSGGWKEVVLPPDENVISLGVGEEFVGLYVGTKDNPNFEGDLIHMFETESGNLRMMYGKTNLDRWMDAVSPGSWVKIRRLDDRKVGQPKPLHMFKAVSYTHLTLPTN